MIAQHVLRTADRVVDAFGLLDRDLDGAGCWTSHSSAAGYGGDAVTAPLRVLLQ